MGKSSPSPPDPARLAQAQGAANAQAVLQSALVNQIGQSTPYGTVTFEGDLPQVDPETGEFRMTKTVIDPETNQQIEVALDPRIQKVSLSEQGQRQFDLSNMIAERLLDRGTQTAAQIQATPALSFDQLPAQISALNLSSGPLQSRVGAPGVADALSAVPEVAFDFGGPRGVAAERIDTNGLTQLAGADDFSRDSSRVEQATFQRALGLLDPEFGRQARALNTQLATRGLPVGGEAHNRAFDQFNRNRNEALTNAALDSVSAGRAEQGRLFGQSLAARGQEFGERSQSAGFANQARAQAFSQALTRGQFANQAQNQAFGQGLTAQNQAFSQGLANAQLANQAQAQQFGQDLNLAGQNANLGNNARQQAISERMLQRSVPINELSAMMRGAPALQTPQFAPPPQLQVAPTNVIDPSLAVFNAQNSQANAQANRLFNLGSTFAMAAFSSRQMKDVGTPVDGDAALAALSELDIRHWRYRPEFGLGSGAHVGPMAEDFKARTGLGDGATLMIFDVLGVMLAALQALSHKVDALGRGKDGERPAPPHAYEAGS